MRRRWQAPRNSLKGSRYPVGLGPPLLQALCASWQLPEPLQVHLWRALCQATWSQAAQWRECVLAFHPAHQDARQFVAVACSPLCLVAVLEQLVQEGVLSRPAASQIEERLLTYVDAQGQWCGAMQPPPPAADGLVEL
jgi:hypothetical protein